MAGKKSMSALAAALPVTESVLVELYERRLADNGTDLIFTFTVQANGPTPPYEALAQLPVKSTKTTYLTAIRNRVKADLLASEGVTLQNNDIIIWPLLE